MRKWFQLSAGLILLLTGLAKLFSGFGTARILLTTDPIFGISFRNTFLLAGAVEVSIALVCLFSKRSAAALALVAWLSASVFAYRLGLWSLGWHRPCACLGTLTDGLGISPKLADGFMIIIASALLFGSYFFLICWREKLGNEHDVPSAKQY